MEHLTKARAKALKAQGFKTNSILEIPLTEFHVEEGALDAGIQALYSRLAQDQARNELIFRDLVAVVDAGRSPLLLTERVGHLETFERRLVPLP